MLNGRAALIVEDDLLISLDLQSMLEKLGTSTVLCARNHRDAKPITDANPHIGLALIEVHNDSKARELIEQLAHTGVAVIILTTDANLAREENSPILVKPVSDIDLASAVERALALRTSGSLWSPAPTPHQDRSQTRRIS